jgi:hypothetical protein
MAFCLTTGHAAAPPSPAMNTRRFVPVIGIRFSPPSFSTGEATSIPIFRSWLTCSVRTTRSIGIPGFCGKLITGLRRPPVTTSARSSSPSRKNRLPNWASQIRVARSSIASRRLPAQAACQAAVGVVARASVLRHTRAARRDGPQPPEKNPPRTCTARQTWHRKYASRSPTRALDVVSFKQAAKPELAARSRGPGRPRAIPRRQRHPSLGTRCLISGAVTRTLC